MTRASQTRHRSSLALVIFASMLTLGCERGPTPTATPEPSPDPAPEAASSSDPEHSSSKPEGCDGADDCGNQGALALLAGEPRALHMLEYACAEGSATGCGNLSSALRGDLVAQDPVAAHQAAARGCELGSAAACVDLGVDESLGLGGTEIDQAAASRHFTTACDGNEAKGCRYVGVLMIENSLGPADTAQQFFEKGCELGDAESCFNAGVVLVQQSDPDLEAARAFMQRSCELGDEDACGAVKQIEAEIEASNAKVPGSNLHVGSATVNGLTVNELECRVTGGGMGLLGNMALIAALAERKGKIAKCGKAGTAAEVRWTATGGKITAAEGVGPEGECVAKHLRGLATPADGECAAAIVL